MSPHEYFWSSTSVVCPYTRITYGLDKFTSAHFGPTSAGYQYHFVTLTSGISGNASMALLDCIESKLIVCQRRLFPEEICVLRACFGIAPRSRRIPLTPTALHSIFIRIGGRRYAIKLSGRKTRRFRSILDIGASNCLSDLFVLAI